MPTIIHVASLDEDGLKHYRIRRHTAELQRDGLFLAEGKRVVLRLLESPLSTNSILTTPTVFEWITANTKQENLETLTVYLASREFMSTLVGYDVQQPILAIAKTPPDVLPDEIVRQKGDTAFIAAIDRLMNPDNLGVILRNCAAFGVDLLIAGESAASPYYRRAVRNSMGTIFEMPVYHSKNLEQTLLDLKNRHGMQIIGAHPAGSASLDMVTFERKCCIVFGNEDAGLSDSIVNICSQTVNIPLIPDVDSFNVANAAAIFLWEAYKQRAL